MDSFIPTYDFEVVTGIFTQGDPDENPSDHPAILPRFGLKEGQTWEEVKKRVVNLNTSSDRVPGVIYKLVFFGRHGEGFHNRAIEKYGAYAWNNYKAKEFADDEFVWGPDPELTPIGEEQARSAKDAWVRERQEGVPLPEAMYCSPFRRAIRTCLITFGGWFLPQDVHSGMKGMHPIIIEDLRETLGVNTCDSRSRRSKTEAEFGPLFKFERGFVEEDELWTKDHRELEEEHDVRTRRGLAKIMAADGAFISVTVHDGVIRSVLRVTGHRPWQMQTGGVIPLLIKASVRKEVEAPQS